MHLRLSRIYLRRGDVLAILLAIALVGGFGALAVTGRWGVLGRWGLLPNFGFGSDWHCTWPGKGDPVCFKDVNEAAKPD